MKKGKPEDDPLQLASSALVDVNPIIATPTRKKANLAVSDNSMDDRKLNSFLSEYKAAHLGTENGF